MPDEIDVTIESIRDKVQSVPTEEDEGAYAWYTSHSTAMFDDNMREINRRGETIISAFGTNGVTRIITARPVNYAVVVDHSDLGEDYHE